MLDTAGGLRSGKQIALVAGVPHLIERGKSSKRGDNKMRQFLNCVFFCAMVGIITPALVAANPTSSGAMTVTATVDPSISLTFGSDASGLALSSGSGTNTATLALGHVAAY